jgi:hypothetical protein
MTSSIKPKVIHRPMMSDLIPALVGSAGTSILCIDAR